MKFDRSFFIQLFVASGLVALAVAWRVHNYQTMALPNLELVTGVTLVAAVALHRYFALLVPLAVMLISDRLIGAVEVSIFVWSSFGLVGLAGLLLRRFKQHDGKLLLGTVSTGLAAAVFFFMWTNFGVWWVGDGVFYPATLNGLLQSYAMGIPFFRGTLLSGVVVAPLLMAAAVYLPRLAKVIKTATRPAIGSS